MRVKQELLKVAIRRRLTTVCRERHRPWFDPMPTFLIQHSALTALRTQSFFSMLITSTDFVARLSRLRGERDLK
jgi:hypothetical protein